MQSPSARRAAVQEVIVNFFRKKFGREEGALVGDVSGLSAGLTSVLAWRRLRPGRLADVRGGRLGGGRRVLACRGELLLQLGDGGLKDIGLRPQTLAIRTRGCFVGDHGGRVDTSHRRDSTL
jgi:hypothetical protein